MDCAHVWGDAARQAGSKPCKKLWPEGRRCYNPMASRVRIASAHQCAGGTCSVVAVDFTCSPSRFRQCCARNLVPFAVYQRLRPTAECLLVEHPIHVSSPLSAVECHKAIPSHLLSGGDEQNARAAAAQRLLHQQLLPPNRSGHAKTSCDADESELCQLVQFWGAFSSFVETVDARMSAQELSILEQVELSAKRRLCRVRDAQTAAINELRNRQALEMEHVVAKGMFPSITASSSDDRTPNGTERNRKYVTVDHRYETDVETTAALSVPAGDRLSSSASRESGGSGAFKIRVWKKGIRWNAAATPAEATSDSPSAVSNEIHTASSAEDRSEMDSTRATDNDYLAMSDSAAKPSERRVLSSSSSSASATVTLEIENLVAQHAAEMEALERHWMAEIGNVSTQLRTSFEALVFELYNYFTNNGMRSSLSLSLPGGMVMGCESEQLSLPLTGLAPLSLPPLPEVSETLLGDWTMPNGSTTHVVGVATSATQNWHNSRWLPQDASTQTSPRGLPSNKPVVAARSSLSWLRLKSRGNSADATAAGSSTSEFNSKFRSRSQAGFGRQLAENSNNTSTDAETTVMPPAEAADAGANVFDDLARSTHITAGKQSEDNCWQLAATAAKAIMEPGNDTVDLWDSISCLREARSCSSGLQVYRAYHVRLVGGSGRGGAVFVTLKLCTGDVSAALRGWANTSAPPRPWQNSRRTERFANNIPGLGLDIYALKSPSNLLYISDVYRQPSMARIEIAEWAASQWDTCRIGHHPHSSGSAQAFRRRVSRHAVVIPATIFDGSYDMKCVQAVAVEQMCEEFAPDFIFPGLQQQIDEAVCALSPRPRVGDFIITKHSNLPLSQAVFHLFVKSVSFPYATSDYTSPGDDFAQCLSPEILQESFGQILEQCVTHGFTSVSFPLLLTESCGNTSTACTPAHTLQKATQMLRCLNFHLTNLAESIPQTIFSLIHVNFFLPPSTRLSPSAKTGDASSPLSATVLPSVVEVVSERVRSVFPS